MELLDCRKQYFRKDIQACTQFPCRDVIQADASTGREISLSEQDVFMNIKFGRFLFQERKSEEILHFYAVGQREKKNI
jgi:hypothetical protein